MSTPSTLPNTMLLTPAEAARLLSFSERKLWSITEPRGDLPALKIGRSVRYSRAALEAWIEQQSTAVA